MIIIRTINYKNSFALILLFYNIPINKNVEGSYDAADFKSKEAERKR